DTEDAGYDIWQNRDYWVANDLSENTVADEIGISSVVVAAGLQNMVLMVMQIGRQRMGMLMVANKRGLAGFTNQDLQNLQILVAQAAIVVENARLFQREMRHDTELVGLQEITHAIGALSNEDEVYVYSDINTRIAGLMSIQMCGVLLYDEVQNYLVAQPPFYGIGEDIIGDYAIDLSQNDVLMELWEESDFWYTNRAMADTVVFSAGMAEMAELAGVEKTLFASLTAGGRKIGVIEVSNKLDGSDFNDNDARLLMIFATQAAAIIENARLVQEVQRRADEANRLRVIAERAGNLVTMQETLAPVLSEVARLTESQLTYLSTIEPGGALVTHPRAVFGAELDSPLRFDVGTDGFEELVSSLQQPLILNDAGESSPYYRAIKQMHIQRMVIVPLFIGERSLGELIIANRERPYTNLDVDMLTGVAAQFASTIDRVRLFEEAEENLNRRVQELAAISSVSRTMNDTLDLPTILDSIRGEATQATGSDGSTIVMIRKVDDWDGEARTPQIVTRIGERDIITGFADLEMHVLENEDVFVVNHYRDVEMTPQPADAVSAVALAIRYAELPVGVIHLHDRRPYLFDEQSVAFLQTLALEASLAFGNALRQHEQQTRNHVIRQRVEQLNQIFELGQLLQTDVDPSVMLDAIAYSIVQSVGFDVVVITMTDPETGLLRRETQAGLPVDVFERSKADVISLDALGGLLQDELKISESYFYPIEVILEWEIAGLDALSAAYSGNRTMHAEGPDA
ncbi:MAG: GAF domain-containing protein, partial [Chloroflexota bacterium]